MNKLKKESIQLLEKCILIHKPEIIEWIINDKLYTLSANEYNTLRDIINDEFLAKGLKQDYEPNNYGILLEKLIDDIGRLFM